MSRNNSVHSHYTLIVPHSPDNRKLTSLEEVVQHLITPGTCKCGLRCPVDIKKDFSFDPDVIPLPSHYGNVPPDHVHCKQSNQPRPSSSPPGTENKPTLESRTASPLTKTEAAKRNMTQFSLFPEVRLGKKLKVGERTYIANSPKSSPVKRKASRPKDAKQSEMQQIMNKKIKLLSLLKTPSTVKNPSSKDSPESTPSKPVTTSPVKSPPVSSPTNPLTLTLTLSPSSTGDSRKAYSSLQEILKQAKLLSMSKEGQKLSPSPSDTDSRSSVSMETAKPVTPVQDANVRSHDDLSAPDAILQTAHSLFNNDNTSLNESVPPADTSRSSDRSLTSPTTLSNSCQKHSLESSSTTPGQHTAAHASSSPLVEPLVAGNTGFVSPPQSGESKLLANVSSLIEPKPYIGEELSIKPDAILAKQSISNELLTAVDALNSLNHLLQDSAVPAENAKEQSLSFLFDTSTSKSGPTSAILGPTLAESSNPTPSHMQTSEPGGDVPMDVSVDTGNHSTLMNQSLPSIVPTSFPVDKDDEVEDLLKQLVTGSPPPENYYAIKMDNLEAGLLLEDRADQAPQEAMKEMVAQENSTNCSLVELDKDRNVDLPVTMSGQSTPRPFEETCNPTSLKASSESFPSTSEATAAESTALQNLDSVQTDSLPTDGEEGEETSQEVDKPSNNLSVNSVAHLPGSMVDTLNNETMNFSRDDFISNDNESSKTMDAINLTADPQTPNQDAPETQCSPSMHSTEAGLPEDTTTASDDTEVAPNLTADLNTPNEVPSNTQCSPSMHSTEAGLPEDTTTASDDTEVAPNLTADLNTPNEVPSNTQCSPSMHSTEAALPEDTTTASSCTEVAPNLTADLNTPNEVPSNTQCSPSMHSTEAGLPEDTTTPSSCTEVQVAPTCGNTADCNQEVDRLPSDTELSNDTLECSMNQASGLNDNQEPTSMSLCAPFATAASPAPPSDCASDSNSHESPTSLHENQSLMNDLPGTDEKSSELDSNTDKSITDKSPKVNIQPHSISEEDRSSGNLSGFAQDKEMAVSSPKPSEYSQADSLSPKNEQSPNRSPILQPLSSDPEPAENINSPPVSTPQFVPSNPPPEVPMDTSPAAQTDPPTDVPVDTSQATFSDPPIVGAPQTAQSDSPLEVLLSSPQSQTCNPLPMDTSQLTSSDPLSEIPIDNHHIAASDPAQQRPMSPPLMIDPSPEMPPSTPGDPSLVDSSQISDPLVEVPKNTLDTDDPLLNVPVDTSQTGDPPLNIPVDTPQTDYSPLNAPVDTPQTDDPPLNIPVDTPQTDDPPLNIPVDTPQTGDPPLNAPVDTPQTGDPPLNAPVDTPQTGDPPPNTPVDTPQTSDPSLNTPMDTPQTGDPPLNVPVDDPHPLDTVVQQLDEDDRSSRSAVITSSAQCRSGTPFSSTAFSSPVTSVAGFHDDGTESLLSASHSSILSLKSSASTGSSDTAQCKVSVAEENPLENTGSSIAGTCSSNDNPSTLKCSPSDSSTSETNRTKDIQKIEAANPDSEAATKSNGLDLPLSTEGFPPERKNKYKWPTKFYPTRSKFRARSADSEVTPTSSSDGLARSILGKRESSLTSDLKSPGSEASSLVDSVFDGEPGAKKQKRDRSVQIHMKLA